MRLAGDWPIFCISDLHLGRGGPLDHFERPGRIEALYGFLDHVERENGALWILGDFLDLWDCDKLGAIVRYHTPLFDRLDELKANGVPGNHDAALRYLGFGHPLLERWGEPANLRIGGKLVHLCHGHEADDFCRDGQDTFGRAVQLAYRRIKERRGTWQAPDGRTVEEFYGEKIESWWSRLHWLLRLTHGRWQPTPAQTQNEDRHSAMLYAYAADARKNHADLYVCGHTHRPGVIDGWYFNTGSWATNRTTFVRIEPNATAGVYEWVNNQAIPYKE